MANELDLERLDENVELSALSFIGKSSVNNLDDIELNQVRAFTSGAVSTSAKEYWYYRFINCKK